MKKFLFGIALLFVAGNLFAQEDKLLISYDADQEVQDVLSLKAGETVDIIISLDYKTDKTYKGLQFDLFLPKGLQIPKDEYGYFWEPLGDMDAKKGRRKDVPVWQIMQIEEGSTETDVTQTYVTEKELGYGRYYRFLCGQTEFYSGSEYFYFPSVADPEPEDLQLFLVTVEATEDYELDPDIEPIYIRKLKLVTADGTIVLDKVSHIEFNLKESGFGTLCIDDDLDFSSLGIKPYVLTDFKENYAKLAEIEKVEANTPVVIKGTPGHYVLVDLSGNADEVKTNLLKGTPDKEFTADANTFAMAKKEKGTGFYRVKAGVVIPQYKAYVENATAVNDFFLFEDATGINTVEKAAATTDVYTITGVKVNDTTQKGIYIQNGKKVVVK